MVENILEGIEVRLNTDYRQIVEIPYDFAAHLFVFLVFIVRKLQNM